MAGPKRNYIQRTGRKVDGVTTVERLLAKPALVPWGYKQGLINYTRLSEEIGRILNLTDLTANQKLDVIQEFIVNFEVQKLYEKRDKAADAGTLAHAFIEHHVKKLPEPPTEKYTREVIDKAEGCFLGFLDWEKTHDVTYVGAEVKVVSEARPFGGTIDHVIETATSRIIKGGVEILDLKTGKDIYLEAKIQVGTYEAAWIELHPDRPVTGDHILRLGETGEFTHRFFPTLRPYFDIFKALLYIDLKLEELGERL